MKAKAFVVDTNVLVLANGRDTTEKQLRCQLASIEALEEVRQHLAVIDNLGCILSEYQRYCNFSSQLGMGDEFFKYLFQHQADEHSCEQVVLTPLDKDCKSFKEFPNTEELQKFDPSDKKFVAVALQSIHKPPILNATDSDWQAFSTALNKQGILVQEICEAL
ncbi:MAG: hypothetical protein R2880_18980 [Deinococcales bacterium]